MPIQVQIHWSDVEKSDALDEHIQREVEHALRHHQDRFTRIDVHVHEDHGGPSRLLAPRFVIEARPAGADPLVVEEHGEDYYAVATGACKKLERTIRHFVDRHR